MKKKALIFFLLKLIKIPLTILTLFFTARFFGVSVDKDIWLLAFSIIQTIDLAFWGPLNETFRTKFITLKEGHNEAYALKMTKSLLVYIFLGCILLLIIAEVFAFDIAKIIAPKYNFEDLVKLTSMLRFVAPWLLLNQIVLIGTSILNSYEVFYIPEISSFISQIINIIILLLFAHTIGIQALVVALYTSHLVLLSFIVYYICKQKIALFSNFSFDFEGFKIFLLFSLPFFASYFFGQLNGFIEKIIAVSLGNGVVSVIDFSRKIPDLIAGVLTSVILSILVPNLTKKFIRKQHNEFNFEFMSSYKLGLFLIASLFIFMVGSSADITQLLYANKQISPSDIILIGKLSILYTLGILGVFTYVIFGMSMMATQKAKLYVVCGISAQVLVIIGNFLLSKFIGVYAFPISFLAAHMVSGLTMYYYYPYNRKIIFFATLRYYAFLFFGAISVYYLKSLIQFDSEIYKMVSNLGVVIIFILVFALIFKIEEIREINYFFSKRWSKQ